MKRMIIERDVECTTRDGVILRADVYRPEGAEKLPVLLERTPYGKGNNSLIFVLTAVERGYAVVLQDCRGRWASDGDGYPFVHEIADGYDAVEWAARQPWANGKVGMFGQSYVGYTQWAAAAAQPPSLKAIIPNLTMSDPQTITYQGGALVLGIILSWGLNSAAMMEITRCKDHALQQEMQGKLIEMMDGMGRGTTFSTLPLENMPLVGKEQYAPFFYDVLQHPTRDAYWDSQRCLHSNIQVPALHIGGWHDIFTSDTVRDFCGVRQNGGSELARSNQKLIFGPWLHGPMEGLVGEWDYGMKASAGVILLDEIQLRWFDYWLKGIQNGIMEEPPVRLFVMGDNDWRNENEFPLARTQYTPYYLHSKGAANSLNGNGSLSPIKPADEPVDTFVYDPRNPVKTRGGSLCCYAPALPPGVYDQRPTEARPDVLVYTTPPLEKDLEVTGPIRMFLWAASSAVDTDFTAKLVDVHTCGYARPIQEGILRARYRNSLEKAELMKPGEVYPFEIDLWATSNVFKAGHCIRVEISSSNFPRFDRNPNTGKTSADSSELIPAVQTIFHDSAHPSHILLPVIPR